MAQPFETEIDGTDPLGLEDPTKKKKPVDPTAAKLQEGSQAADVIAKAGEATVDPNSMRSILTKYEETLNDPQFQTQVPRGTREDLAAKLAAAETEYKDRQTTNDWGQVAQAFANAFTNYDLARRGLQNYAGPGLQFDFEGRGKRLLEEHKQKKQDIGADYEAGQKEYDIAKKAKDETLGRKLGFLGKALDVTTDEERMKQAREDKQADLARRISEFDKEQENKQKEAEATRAFKEKESSKEFAWRSTENALDRQNRLALEKLKQEEDKNKSSKNKNLAGVLSSIDKQNQVLSNQLKNSEKKVQALDNLTEELINYDNLPRKDKIKADRNISKLAAEAGVSPEDVRKTMQEVPATGGFLGFGQKRDPQEQTRKVANQYKKTLMDEINSLKEQVGSNLQRRENIAITGEVDAPTQQAATPTSKPAASPKRDPKIEQYAQQYKLDYDSAKKVLTGRGYKPAE